MKCLHWAALAGMITPLCFGGVIIGLTLLQYEFLRGLRWHPLTAPTTDWPSGLALGPYGWLMVATFIASGLLLIGFAAGMAQSLGAGLRLGPGLLMLAGLAMLLLAFKTDPTFVPTPRTLGGLIHDLAFGLLGLSLLPALFALADHFRRDAYWRGHAAYTLLTGLLVVPAFLLRGVGFYLFLLAVLLWFELTAIRLWRLAQRGAVLV